MKEYIEREVAIQNIIKAQESLESNIDKEWTKNKPCFKGLAWANRIILETPAADVTPIVHGEWEFKTKGYATCSECNTNFEILPTKNMFRLNNSYCRCCGTKMDGGK